MLHLAGGSGEPCRLELDGPQAAPLPLADAVRIELRRTGAPLSKAALRKQLRVNNARLSKTLETLENRGVGVRGPSGWSLPDDADQVELGFPRFRGREAAFLVD